MDEDLFINGSGGLLSMCFLHEAIAEDDEGYKVCGKCGASYYDGPLRERDLWDAADAIWSQGYSGPGLPPSISTMLE